MYLSTTRYVSDFIHDSCAIFLLKIDVLLHPSGPVIRPLHGQIMYTCITNTNTDEVQWMINETNLEELNLTSVNITNGGGRGVIIIANITEEFNGSLIQCRSKSDVDKPPSQISQLYLQG